MSDFAWAAADTIHKEAARMCPPGSQPAKVTPPSMLPSMHLGYNCFSIENQLEHMCPVASWPHQSTCFSTVSRGESSRSTCFSTHPLIAPLASGILRFRSASTVRGLWLSPESWKPDGYTICYIVYHNHTPQSHPTFPFQARYLQIFCIPSILFNKLPH